MTAAQIVDTRLVRISLATFKTVHHRYLQEQQIVEAHEAELAAAAAMVRRRAQEQDDSFKTLMVALISDGQPRHEPLRQFGVASPSVLQRRAIATKTKAIHRLAATVGRDQSCAKASLRAAAACEAAAAAVDRALAAMQSAQAALRLARVGRDALGRQWDLDLRRLNYHAKSFKGDAAPYLHAALFANVRRRRKKK